MASASDPLNLNCPKTTRFLVLGCFNVWIEGQPSSENGDMPGCLILEAQKVKDDETLIKDRKVQESHPLVRLSNSMQNRPRRSR